MFTQHTALLKCDAAVGRKCNGLSLYQVCLQCEQNNQHSANLQKMTVFQHLLVPMYSHNHSFIQIFIFLPLVDEDTGVFGNEVAIQRCVFCGAKRRTKCQPMEYLQVSVPYMLLPAIVIFLLPSLFSLEIVCMSITAHYYKNM